MVTRLPKPLGTEGFGSLGHLPFDGAPFTLHPTELSEKRRSALPGLQRSSLPNLDVKVTGVV